MSQRVKVFKQIENVMSNVTFANYEFEKKNGFVEDNTNRMHIHQNRLSHQHHSCSDPQGPKSQ